MQTEKQEHFQMPDSCDETKSIESSEMQRLIVVIGATGVGKSRLGIKLAKALGGEIVNVDAMQMYKGLGIATSKVPMSQREGVPHHLLDFLDINDPFTVRSFRDKALSVINEISCRGNLPVIVGGTLYYIQALLWPSLLDETPEYIGSDSTPKKDAKNDVILDNGEGNAKTEDEARERIRAVISSGSLPRMYRMLEEFDPQATQRIHPNDQRKIVAALEAIVRTGHTRTELYKRQRIARVEDDLRFKCNIVWLTCEPEAHFNMLCDRVDQMMEDGLLQEAMQFIDSNKDILGIFDEQNENVNQETSLQSSNSALSAGVFQAIGYKEFLPAYLKTSEHGLSIEDPEVLSIAKENAELLKIRHRKYAQKQLKWIRKRMLPRNAPIHSLDVTEYCSVSNEDSSEWFEKNVVRPAVELCSWYNSNSMSSDPLNCVRRNIEPTTENTGVGRKLKKYVCECCDVVLIGDDQWQKHVASKKHKRIARSMA